MNGMSDAPGSSSLAPLNATGVDFGNATQAMDFLSAMLDDSILQYDGKAYSQYFWYGIVTVIGLATLYNILYQFSHRLR